MNENKFAISNILTPISFVLSLVAMILVVLDSGNFQNKNNENNYQKATTSEINKSQDNKQNEINEDEVNNISSQTFENSTQETNEPTKQDEKVLLSEMKDLVRDLESSYSPKTTQEKSKTQSGNVHQILLKSFEDKDDATLELNRLRIQHKDLTSKIETSVKPFKRNGERKFGIFGKITGPYSQAEKYCENFESRGVECFIV